MRVAAACVLCALSVSCASTPFGSSPFGGDGPPAKPVKLPPPVRFDWHGFAIALDPTVELWSKQVHVDLRAVVGGALANIEGRLHGPPVPIEIEAGTYGTARALGIGGTTDPYTGRVQVSLDLGSSLPLRQLLSVWIPLSLAHELDHAKRILSGPGYGATLGEAVVTEGSAEAFVREAYPDAPAIPWVRALDGADEARVWARLRAAMNTPNDPVTYGEWFYGDHGLPRWAGYRIGYAICERYLRTHPGTTAAALTGVPAAEIVRSFR
jgi:hypothetical protein